MYTVYRLSYLKQQLDIWEGYEELWLVVPPIQGGR